MRNNSFGNIVRLLIMVVIFTLFAGINLMRPDYRWWALVMSVFTLTHLGEALWRIRRMHLAMQRVVDVARTVERTTDFGSVGAIFDRGLHSELGIALRNCDGVFGRKVCEAPTATIVGPGPDELEAR